MDLRYEIITEEDLPELTAVITRAFDDDSRRHLGVPKGGPEGYDTGEFFRKWLFPYEQTRGYKILLDGQVVGAFIVWIMPDDNNFLGTIFVDPAFQRQGIGSRTWQYIEAAYPQTKTWTLETPGYAKSNHRFYEEKCGFTKVKEKPGDLPGGLWVYRKTLRP